ncbi:MAG: DeoR family transcriptional regulator [Candidatus Komeilibacteria bacterium]
MSRESYIRLTLGVYKVSALFSEQEPLRHDLRELADEILASLLCDSYQGCSENIKLIQKLFDLAESRGLADPRNFLVLRREYDKVSDLFENTDMGSEQPASARIGYAKSVTRRGSFLKNGRHKKRQEIILDILKNKDKVKLKDLIKSFPGINRRTILRDLDTFCESGLVGRHGSGRGICYTIKSVTL